MINFVHIVVKKMNHPVRRSALLVHKNLAPVTSNVNWWFSIYIMLQPYQEVIHYLSSLHMVEIDKVLLSDREGYDIATLCKDLRKLDTVTKEIPKEAGTLDHARALFDSVIKAFSRLNPSSEPGYEYSTR